jgi:hypothetical protein
MIESINQTQHKLDRYLNSKSYINLFFLFFIVKFIFLTATSIIATKIDPSLTSNPIDDEKIIYIFVMLVIVAPVLETFIFQLAIIEIGFEFKWSKKLLVSISSVLFALSHHYNWIYVGIMFFIGFIFAYSYMIVRNKYDMTKATLFVISLHAMSNLIAFLNNNIFEFF